MGFRLEGYIVSSLEEKELYSYFGEKAVCPEELAAWIDSNPADRTVYISSYGGNLDGGSQMYTALKEAGNITVIIDGLAASAASLIAMGGEQVKISPAGEIMIHNVIGGGKGDYRQMESIVNGLKTGNQSIINAYKLKTGLSENQLQEYMDNETWFDAKEAVQLGFADEILFDNNNILSQTKVSIAAVGWSRYYETAQRIQDEIKKVNRIKPKNRLFLLETRLNENRRKLHEI